MTAEESDKIDFYHFFLEFIEFSLLTKHGSSLQMINRPWKKAAYFMFGWLF